MFLSQLYKHSKWLFAAVVVFTVCQLVINFKRGMVVSPFYHYGMYSEVIDPKPGYEVFEVWANGQQLRGQDFMPWTWDKIIQPLTYYSSIPKSNQLFKDDIRRLMGKLHLAADEQQFLVSCDYPRFENWYKEYLAKILHQPVSTVDLRLRTYTYSAGILQPTNNVQLLSNLCR